jgi:hypothetical protein
MARGFSDNRNKVLPSRTEAQIPWKTVHEKVVVTHILKSSDDGTVRYSEN